SESSCSMTTCARTSGCGLETTTANCCAAALRLASTTALSRSTAQYSQPTLLLTMAATLQSAWQMPWRQAKPMSPSHVAPSVMELPSALQMRTVVPLQEVDDGSHMAQRRSDLLHTWLFAAQSSAMTHCEVVASQRSSAPLQRIAPG